MSRINIFFLFLLPEDNDEHENYRERTPFVFVIVMTRRDSKTRSDRFKS